MPSRLVQATLVAAATLSLLGWRAADEAQRVNASCYTNADCSPGQRCSKQVVMPPAPRPGEQPPRPPTPGYCLGGGQKGDLCESNMDCTGGLLCRAPTTSPQRICQ
jgi:hypothetical protein